MLPSETLWPLSGEQGAVTSRFGWEDDPASGKRRWNSGVWIASAPDTPVRAVLPGTVVYAGPREGRGHTVILEHNGGYRSYYSNLEPSSIQIGEQVRHGAEFARIATQPSPAVNGENSASLHFELKKGEMALNPESALGRT
jgi:lysostaphin